MTDMGVEQKTRFSTQVSPAVQARVRATVRGMASATGTDYSLAQLVEDALCQQRSKSDPLAAVEI